MTDRRLYDTYVKETTNGQWFDLTPCEGMETAEHHTSSVQSQEREPWRGGHPHATTKIVLRRR